MKTNQKIYFQNLKIKNFRCFGIEQRIDFYRKGQEDISRWNVILGENGVGKTSILRALALTVINSDNGRKWRNEIPWESFKRSGTKTSETPLIHYETLLGEARQIKFGINIVGSEPVLIGSDDQINEFDKNLVLFAYGASRRMGNKGITSLDDFSVRSLFQENVELINAEEWLVQADYLSLKDKQYLHRKNKVIDAIKTIMRNEVTDIEIGTSKNSHRPHVLFKSRYGWVPLHELSMGYKTFLAWMIDFAKGMIERYPSSKNPLAEPAVCLLDEIDLHLHPSLQRDVVEFLLETFKQTQFIVSSHSPLIVQSTPDVNLILLKKQRDYVVTENKLELIKNWRVDQILVSDLFGLKSSRSNDTENLMHEREGLLSKKSLTKKDEERVATIEKELDKLPIWDTVNEKRAESAMQKLAKMLENKENKNDQV